MADDKSWAVSSEEEDPLHTDAQRPSVPIAPTVAPTPTNVAPKVAPMQTQDDSWAPPTPEETQFSPSPKSNVDKFAENSQVVQALKNIGGIAALRPGSNQALGEQIYGALKGAVQEPGRFYHSVDNLAKATRAHNFPEMGYSALGSIPFVGGQLEGAARDFGRGGYAEGSGKLFDLAAMGLGPKVLPKAGAALESAAPAISDTVGGAFKRSMEPTTVKIPLLGEWNNAPRILTSARTGSFLGGSSGMPFGWHTSKVGAALGGIAGALRPIIEGGMEGYRQGKFVPREAPVASTELSAGETSPFSIREPQEMPKSLGSVVDRPKTAASSKKGYVPEKLTYRSSSPFEAPQEAPQASLPQKSDLPPQLFSPKSLGMTGSLAKLGSEAEKYHSRNNPPLSSQVPPPYGPQDLVARLQALLARRQ